MKMRRRHATTQTAKTGTVESAMGGRRSGVRRPVGYAGRIAQGGRMGDESLGENNRSTGGKGAPGTGLNKPGSSGGGSIGGGGGSGSGTAPAPGPAPGVTEETRVPGGSVVPSHRSRIGSGGREALISSRAAHTGSGDGAVASFSSYSERISTRISSATRTTTPTKTPVVVAGTKKAVKGRGAAVSKPAARPAPKPAVVVAGTKKAAPGRGAAVSKPVVARDRHVDAKKRATAPKPKPKPVVKKTVAPNSRYGAQRI